jgi:isopentenyl-diphosphate Delta-isomerase
MNAGALDSDQVVLVDGADRPVGVAAKHAAHVVPGQLHRAFSVFIHDDAERLLLQQRATSKYHFGGRWTNACCSHPRPGEDVIVAAHRRLYDEIGLRSSDLARVGMFEYRAYDPVSGLVEHELDHVIVGRSDDLPRPDPSEASDFMWVTMAELDDRVNDTPELFTPWLRPALDIVLASRTDGPRRGTKRSTVSASTSIWSPF